MGTKNSRALDARVKGVMSEARGQETQQNDANIASGPHTRTGGASSGWGDKKQPKVIKRPGQ